MPVSLKKVHLILAVGILLACEPLAGKDKVAKKPEFTPGKVTQVDTPKAGYHNYFLVYLPKNYKPDRPWPVILFFHGLQAEPNVSLFQALTKGRNFIIVGVSYQQKKVGKENEKLNRAELEKQYKVETRAVKDFYLPYLCKQFRVDKRLIFMSGFSRGGCAASIIAENLPDISAGLIILGSGRGRQDLSLPNARKFRGKPVFIGVAEKSKARPESEKTATFYKKHGADVVLDIFTGLEQGIDMQNKNLHDWLIKYGPLRAAQQALVVAKKAEKAQRLGRAYAAYKYVADISKEDKTCQAAAAAAKRLADDAEKQLTAADKAASEKRHVEACKILTTLATSYEGSEFGKRAKEQLEAIKKDPETKALIEQAEIDAKADAIEARAVAAEKAKKYARAIKLYETYVAHYPKATRYKEVAARLKALKSNKDIQKSIREGDAERKCKNWLQMADNFINAGMPDSAVPYLQKILKEYDGTKWAKEARQRLKEIKNSSK